MTRKLSPRTLLHRLLTASTLPIYILDDQRQIVFCNPACARWAGVGQQQLLGLHCNYHSEPADDPAVEMANLLCPPPDALAGRPMTARLQGNSSESLLAHYVPLGGEAIGGELLVPASQTAPFSPPASGSQPVLVWMAPAGPPPAAPWIPSPAEVLPEQLHECLRMLRRDQAQRHAPRQLIGTTPAMRRVRRQLKLAESASRIVITGPIGSGREHVARTIHYARAQDDEPLIPLSCGLLDAELLETTLSALTRHAAERNPPSAGTLLLLDIEQLPAPAQASLQEILNANQLHWNTLATSLRPLSALVAEQRLREDLACSLGTLEISLPPLRERTADIPLLAQRFLEEHNARGGRQLSGFADPVLDLLVAYEWPENVDELSRAIDQACARAKGNWLMPEDLPREICLAERAAARAPREATPIDLDAFLERVERELFQRALQQAKGNKTRASQLLGIHRARFHRRASQLGLE